MSKELKHNKMFQIYLTHWLKKVVMLITKNNNIIIVTNELKINNHGM